MLLKSLLYERLSSEIVRSGMLLGNVCPTKNLSSKIGCTEMLPEKLRRKTIVKNRAYRNAAQKNCEEKLSSKIGVPKYCSKVCRTKSFSEMSLAEYCRKNYEEKLLSKIGVPKCCWKVCRTKPFSKMSVAECCRKNYEEKLSSKIGVPKCCRKNYEEKISSKIGVPKCCSNVCRTKPFSELKSL